MVSTQKQALADRHAVVTGGGRGIGAAVARALLERGARVTLLGRNEEILRVTSKALSAFGTVDTVVADVSARSTVDAAMQEAANRLGVVEILVNNAGQASSAPFHKTGPELWEQMISANLTGTFNCTQAVLGAMLAAGWGRIVNVASTAGMRGYPYVAAYCAAKHGVIGLTRALALEVAAKGVTVNAVCPGFTETDIVHDAIANIVSKTERSEDEAKAELAAHNPQKRLIQPDEVASAVAWLCLPESQSMNGVALPVAGGEVM